MTHASCIFCRIIRGEIPSPRVFENDQCIVIRDIQPLAKVHLLVIPKVHFGSLTEIPDGVQGEALLGVLMQTAVRVARDHGIVDAGFRTVINTGRDSGQSVFHLHVHVLGGEQLRVSFA